MGIQKIPLARQLARLRDGNPAHPEFNRHAIRSMADIPITAYLHDSKLDQMQLMNLLNISPGQKAKLTYQQIAAHIDKLWRQDQTRCLANAAIEVLAGPILYCYEKRENAYSSTENPA